MKIKLLCVGKNNRSIWLESLKEYSKRVNQYVSFTVEYVYVGKIGKKSIPYVIKKDESKKLLLKIKKDDVVVFLYERGKKLSSTAFSKTIENYQSNSANSLVFVVSGPYGFLYQIYTNFINQMSLWDMTFSHQMVRLFFCEQLYRAT